MSFFQIENCHSSDEKFQSLTVSEKNSVSQILLKITGYAK